MVAALHAVLAAGFDEVIVVTGAADLSAVLPDAVTVLVNPRWHLGLASSLSLGLGHCRRRGHRAAVIGLGDMPSVGTAAWKAVAASEAPIAVASFAGQRRPPVRLAEEQWKLLPLEGDVGARSLWSQPEAVEIPCEGDPWDVDTIADLARLRAGAAS
ncbi:MAG: hypothetical protein JWM85_880 [Acidimicrobiaceae bacterium]|nr:hypothetical protein [Acidimicrobiaceae bacterium]